MDKHTELTEVNLQPVLPPVQLRAGKFYRARNGSIWCCFQYQHPNYLCVRTSDNVVAAFEPDGRMPMDSGLAENTLVHTADEFIEKACAPRDLTTQAERHTRMLATVDDLLARTSEILQQIHQQTEDVSEGIYRLRYARKVFELIASGESSDTAARTIAKDMLLWLADRELNERNIGMDYIGSVRADDTEPPSAEVSS
jgi:hypothetical protein